MSTILVAEIGGTTVKIGFVAYGPQTYVRRLPTIDLRNQQPVVGLASIGDITRDRIVSCTSPLEILGRLVDCKCQALWCILDCNRVSVCK